MAEPRLCLSGSLIFLCGTKFRERLAGGCWPTDPDQIPLPKIGEVLKSSEKGYRNGVAFTFS